MAKALINMGYAAFVKLFQNIAKYDRIEIWANTLPSNSHKWLVLRVWKGGKMPTCKTALGATIAFLKGANTILPTLIFVLETIEKQL